MKETSLSLSVLIADDSGVVRERLAVLLGEVPGVSIVAETETVAGTLEGIRRLRPAVVVLDINMPGGSGLDVLRRMGEERIRAVVIVLTNFAFPEYERKAREYGASAFLDKSREFTKVADLVRGLSEQVSANVASEGKIPNGSTTEITEPVGAETRVQELNRLLLATREINQLIVRERDPQQLLAKTCIVLIKTRGYALAWIGLVQPGSKQLATAACAGKQAGFLDDMSATRDEGPMGQGAIGAAIRTGQPWLCQDTATDPRFALWRTPALARGLASVAVVPMIQGGRVLGALAVYADHSGAFHEEEVSLLNEVAGDLALALRSIEREKERHQAEARLRLVNTALESAANAVAITDREGVITWANPAFSQLTGYSFEELRGRKPSILRSDTQDAATFRNVWEALLAGWVWRSEMINRRKDGSFYTVDITITPVLNEQAEITHFVVVKQEVTERKQAELALQQSAAEFRAMFEVASIGMAQADVHTGRWLRVNQEMCAITGYSAEELLQMRVPDITHPDDRQQDWELFQRVVRGDVPDYRLEKRYVRKDGAVAWVNVNMTVIRDASGQPTRTMAAIEDITERRASERRLRQLSRAVEQTASTVVITDIHGNIEYANPRFAETTGYSLGEALGKNPRILKSGSTSAAEYAKLWQTITSGRTWRGEFHNKKRNGELYWEYCSISPVNDEQGAISHFVAVKEDITERKQLEAQLRQSQKMEGIGQLAGGVAHDFNNLLSVMRCNAELLLMNAEQNSPETNECLKHIEAAAERAANLTRQLLLFSRRQTMQSQPLVLNELVKNLTKMLTRVIREDIRLECRYAEPLPFVQADPGMLEQVLLNLVVNSRDAMPGGGQLLITTEGLRFDSAHAPTNPDARKGKFVCLSVSDTGTGIAPEHLERIFEPFFTTKEPGKGTGLGLATVYGIVKQHQGWVEVSSRFGQGTTFKVFLPAIPPPAKTATAPAEAQLRGGSETILLVEDDYSVRVIMRQVLEAFKYKVYEATCAREAVEVWAQHQGEIALLLTDMVMPEGVSGRNLAEQLRAKSPGLKFIFMSGYSPDLIGKNTDFVRQTKSHFLPKPCSTSILVRTVRQCLDEQ
ncbi:putative Histidine kinase [Verrucomicrobia bacterium]|nr:putative Histidine kinase [Verrucomicrobiota bacterium]